MFYAVLQARSPTIVVQPDLTEIDESAINELIERLHRHFRCPVALVVWDERGSFQNFGYPVTEDAAASEELVWRDFALPEVPGIPF